LGFASALQKDGKVAVTWSTAIEQNNAHFLIEKSKDGRSFNTLAKVATGKNSVTKKDYTVLDNYPANGLNYYRLTQVDKDGRSIVFGVKTVNIQKNQGGIIVYPNPVSGTKINIEIPAPALNKVNIKLLDLTGKLIYTGAFTPNGNSVQITLPYKPAAGIYFLKIEGYTPVKIIVN